MQKMTQGPINPTSSELESLTQMFSIFSDMTRLRIICEIGGGELSVSEICEKLQMSQPAISHQLRILKSARVAKSRREGRNILYSLEDSHVLEMLSMGILHIRHENGM